MNFDIPTILSLVTLAVVGVNVIVAIRKPNEDQEIALFNSIADAALKGSGINIFNNVSILLSKIKPLEKPKEVKPEEPKTAEGNVEEAKK
jgi:hypothetical protein